MTHETITTSGWVRSGAWLLKLVPPPHGRSVELARPAQPLALGAIMSTPSGTTDVWTNAAHIRKLRTRKRYQQRVIQGLRVERQRLAQVEARITASSARFEAFVDATRQEYARFMSQNTKERRSLFLASSSAEEARGVEFRL